MSNPEAKTQAAILDLIRVAYPQVIAAHVANGGYVMEPRVAAKLKWQGLLPGFPDLICMWPPGQFALMEVKSPVGRLTDAQRALFPRLEAIGVRVAVVRSVSDAEHALDLWGAPSRKAAA